MSLKWISSFLDAQAADLGSAQNTLEAYGRDLKDFLMFLEQKGSSFKTASRSLVEGYLVYCEAQGLAAATKARRLSSIKQLYRFAFEEDLRKDNPAIQVRGPGKDKRLPKSLSTSEVNRLLESARKMPKTKSDKMRLTCLMELGLKMSHNRAKYHSARYGFPPLRHRLRLQLLLRHMKSKERVSLGL